MTLILAAVVLASADVPAQDLFITIPNAKPLTNPLEGNAEAITAGMGAFRVRCADCHGMDARGIRAPDITQVWAKGRTDDRLFGTIRNGVTATEMPAFPAPARPTRTSGGSSRISARSRRRRRRSVGAGTRARRRTSSRASCVSCHRVDEQRRPPRARPLAHRRRARARGDGAADPRRRERLQDRVRTGDADHARWRADPRREEERRSVLRADHGQPRADSGIPSRGHEGGRRTRSSRPCRHSAPTD